MENNIQAPLVVNLRKHKYDVYIGMAGKGKDGYEEAAREQKGFLGWMLELIFFLFEISAKEKK